MKTKKIMDTEKKKKKMSGKKKAVIGILSAFIVASSALVAVHFMNTKPSESMNPQQEENEEENERVTYSSEYVAEIDKFSKEIVSSIRMPDYSSTVYGKDIDANAYVAIDNENAYDKRNGKYKEEAKAEVFDREKEEADEESLLYAIKQMEEKGKHITSEEGVHLFSSKDAIDESSMDIYDIAMYVDDDGQFEEYMKMTPMTKAGADILTKNLSSKKSVTIRKYVMFATILHGDRQSVDINRYSIKFDGALKKVMSDDGSDISDTDDFKNISKNNVFTFLQGYMKKEGIDLDLVSDKPCTDYIYSRRYEFEKEQKIIKDMKNINAFNGLECTDTSSVFDVGDGHDTDIHTVYPKMISNRVTYQLTKEKSIDFSIVYEIICE